MTLNKSAQDRPIYEHPVFTAIAAVIALVLFGVCAYGFWIIFYGPTGTPAEVATHKSAKRETLAKYRAAHPTVLTKKGPSPDQFDNTVPPGVKVVQYTSQGKKLMAWLIEPNDKLKHAAVVFAHGGFSLGAGDIEQAMPFANAGFIVMLPSWRGENGNPGYFEMCGGEVEDAVSAIDYLSKNKNVDKNNIFAAGHSIGATTVLLAAEMSNKLKKLGACGGVPSFIEQGRAYDDPPFDTNSTELKRRSMGSFLEDLNCPVKLYYGSNDAFEQTMKRDGEKMSERAKPLGKTISVTSIPDCGHLSALAPAIKDMIIFFQTN